MVRRRSHRFAALAAAALIAPLVAATGATSGVAATGGDDTPVLLHPKGETTSSTGWTRRDFDKLRDAYYWSRLLSGDEPIIAADCGPAAPQGASRRRTSSTG